MTLFLLLINYIASLASVQLLRGDLPSTQPMNFGQVFTAFLAIYQICSSENWTNVLYAVTTAEITLGQVIIAATFISCWLLFANCELCIARSNGLIELPDSYRFTDVHCCDQREFSGSRRG
jgi:hypothetical protein